jgi:hypothetical protein
MNNVVLTKQRIAHTTGTTALTSKQAIRSNRSNNSFYLMYGAWLLPAARASHSDMQQRYFE